MVNGKNIQIYQVQENKDGRGVSNTLFITPRYLDEPPFTLEQEKALYETAEAFLLVNRARDRNKRKADRIRDALIAYSLNDVTEDGTELGEFVRSAKDSFRELEEQENLQELLAELMPALTEKQRSHIIATLEGYKAREVMQQQHESVQEYHANNRAIKKAAREVLPAFLCGGGGIAYAWAA